MQRDVRCPFCNWLRVHNDKIGKAILALHVRTEHQS